MAAICMATINKAKLKVYQIKFEHTRFLAWGRRFQCVIRQIFMCVWCAVFWNIGITFTTFRKSLCLYQAYSKAM